MLRLHVGLLLLITLACLHPIYITSQNTTTHQPTTSTPISSNVTTSPPTSIPSTSPSSPPSISYECVTLPSSSICSSVLSYSHVWIPRGECIDMIESRIHNSYSLFWSTLSQTCRPHLASYMCQQVYSPCQSCGSIGSSCAAAVGNCSSTEKFQHQLLTESTSMISADSCAALPPPRANCTAEPAGFTPTPMYPRCEPYRGTICQGVLSSSYSVFVPANFTQESMEALLSMTTKLWGTAKVANGCLDSAARYLCTTSFPRCDSGVLAPLGVSAPFPRFPCRSVCNEFTERCADSMLSYFPENMIPNCTSQGTIAPAPTVVCGVEVAPAMDDYPITSSNFGTLMGVPLITQCNTLSSSEIAAQSTRVICPSPLINEIVTDMVQSPIFPGGSCAAPCNAQFEYTNGEWDTFGRFCIAMSVISFILGSFLFWTWLCIPSKRKQRNTLYFNFCVMMLSFIVLLGYIVNEEPKNVGCKSPAQTYLQQDGGFCVFQGVTVYFLAFAGIWWWTIIAIDLFISIVVLPRRTDRQSTILTRIYHTLAWCIPGICTIILLSRQNFGGQAMQTFCWIGINTQGWEIWAFFVYPFGVLTCVGFAAIITIMLMMAKSATNPRLRRRWKKYIRPILFMIQFGVLFIIVFGNHMQNLRIDQDRVYESAEEFFTCIMTPEGSQESCGTDGRPRFRPHLSWLFAGHFTICGQGLVNFITYGTQWSNFVEWKKLIVALLTGKAMSYHTSGDKNSTTKQDSTYHDSKHEKSTRSTYISSDRSNPTNPQNHASTKPTSSERRLTVSTTHVHRTGVGVELMPGRMHPDYIDDRTPRVSVADRDESGFAPQMVDRFAISTPRSPHGINQTPSHGSRALLDSNVPASSSTISPRARGASSSTSSMYTSGGTIPSHQYVNQAAILDEVAYQQQARAASITQRPSIPAHPPYASRGSATNFV